MFNRHNQVIPRKGIKKKDNQTEVDFNKTQDVFYIQPKVIVRTQARGGNN